MGVLEQWTLEDDRTKERQKEASEITEEHKDLSSLLAQLGNASQVAFLYLYKMNVSLLTSFTVMGHILAWNPIISLKCSHSLYILCRCFPSTFYNRNHLVLNSILLCDILV